MNNFIEKIVALVTARVENSIKQKMVTNEMKTNFENDLSVINTKISNIKNEAAQVEAALVDLSKRYPFVEVEDQLKAIYKGYEIVKLVADKNAWSGNNATN
jgi:archaellum component FlaC